jgi:hypothetical protein
VRCGRVSKRKKKKVLWAGRKKSKVTEKEL